MNAFAIRCYGKRWLGLTPLAPRVGEAVDGFAPAPGRKPYRWVPDVADAEKFGSRGAAQLFVNGLKGDGYEIVALTPSGRGMAA